MATKRWLGAATAVYDLWTVSLSGTVTSQTYTMTVNGKTITYVAGGGDTSTTILAGLVTNWNASLAAEFAELTAGNATSSTFTLTSDVAGIPHTISVSTSGSATFSIANTTPGTGPNDFTNAQNWSGGVAPANSDTLVFDNGSVDCKYNLSTSLTGITLQVKPGFTGGIGNPLINSDSSPTYAEYRTAYLTLAGGTAEINGPSMIRCNLAFGANTAVVRVLGTGQRPDKNVPVVLITGGDGSSTLSMLKGDAATAFYAGTTATFVTITTDYTANAPADVTLYCGSGTTLTTVTKNGGVATINSNVTTLTQKTAGGTLTVQDGTVGTLNVQGGTVYYNSSGTLTTGNVSNTGVLDFNHDTRAVTVTNPINLYGDFSFVYDDLKRVSSGVLSVNTNQTTKLNVSHGSNNVNTFT